VISNQIFIDATLETGFIAALASEEMDDIVKSLPEYKGKYLLCFDPLDGSSNLDVNVAVGSIFSILKMPKGQTPQQTDFFQNGSEQIAAGYAIYGPAIMLVLTFGKGTFGFTLDDETGEFVLTHPDMKIPRDTQEFAINASNSRFWEPPVKRYVNECLMGRSGARGKDFNMRWIASMVAEAHRILMRGGVFLYPKDNKDLKKPGRLRLLYEANPIGFIIEQAGGRISNGHQNILQITPQELHQRIGVIFGSANEVERIEDYYKNPEPAPHNAPLFGHRSLFRDTI
jgi:fructose-1,6-bisphosphatase I/sedoheptulose-1,7-bisphosphatase